MWIADRSLRLLAVLAALGLASVASAGGPLIVDSTSGRPYTYPVGRTVPVHHDLGDFAVVIDWVNYPATVTFDNAVGAGPVRTGFRAVSYTHLTLPTTPYV